MIDRMNDTIDMASLMDRLEGDRELLVELIGLYFDDEQGLIDAIAAAVRDGDAAAIARSAHTLKGSVGNFCAPAAHAAAAALEAAGREGRVGDAPALFERMTAELDKVRQALRALADQKDR
jgi:two-component system, sensor histidine kinase and response regulator